MERNPTISPFSSIIGLFEASISMILPSLVLFFNSPLTGLPASKVSQKCLQASREISPDLKIRGVFPKASGLENPYIFSKAGLTKSIVPLMLVMKIASDEFSIPNMNLRKSFSARKRFVMLCATPRTPIIFPSEPYIGVFIVSTNSQWPSSA